MQLWFVLAIATACFWGSFGIFAKLSIPKLGVSRFALLIILIQGILYFLGLYMWHTNLSITLEDGVLAATSCIVGTIAPKSSVIARVLPLVGY